MKVTYAFDEHQCRRDFEVFQRKKGRETLRDSKGVYVWNIVQNEWESWCNSRYSQKITIPKMTMFTPKQYEEILISACKTAGITLEWDTEPSTTGVSEYNIV